MAHETLNNSKQPYGVLRSCIFTLSNIISEGCEIFSQVLDANLIGILHQIFKLIVIAQIEQQLSLDDQENLKSIKTEIIYCIRNCSVGIQDTLLGHGVQLILKSINQGALLILIEALDYQSSPIDTNGL